MTDLIQQEQTILFIASLVAVATPCILALIASAKIGCEQGRTVVTYSNTHTNTLINDQV